MTSPLDVLDDGARAGLPRAEHPLWCDPMKAVLSDDHFSDDEWVYERKLDGIRLLVHRQGDDVRLLTRNRKRRNDSFPEIVDAMLAQSVQDIVLDAEVVAFDGAVTSFSRLQGRSQLQDPRRALATGIAVHLYVFDVLHLDGHDLRGLPLRDRKRVLRAALTWEEPLRFTAHRNGDGEAFLEEACTKGWEGLIAKRADAPYRGSRSRDWLKFKCVDQQELVIGGFTDPNGGRSGFGSLLMGYFDGDGDLRYAGKVGTGFDDATLRRLRTRMDGIARATTPFFRAEDLPEDAHWVTPTLVAQVGFSEWTHNDRLRHPRFLGLRDDKDASEVRRERPRATTPEGDDG